MSDRIPVILDTDIGSDIDDAVALAYLLRQPRCELVGITTVSGDVQQRAACAEVICREGGQPNVPIYAGAAEVLIHGPGQPTVPQYAAIQKRPHRLDRQANYAVQWLRSTIRQRPGEITLLSIGPFTNVALLLALDPDIAWMLKGLVSMAGIFYGAADAREWNVLVDPIASSIVYNKGLVKGHVSIGLDVTTKCVMPAPEVRRRFTAPPLPVVCEMAEVWFKERAQMTFHDPLAAVTIFHPEVCAYETGRVTVPIEADEKKAGVSCFKPAAAGPHKVAKTVDSARFFERYFSVFD